MQEKSKEWEFVSMDKEVKYLMHDQGVLVVKLPIDMEYVHGVCVCKMETKEKGMHKEMLCIKVFVQDDGMIHRVESVNQLRFMEH